MSSATSRVSQSPWRLPAEARTLVPCLACVLLLSVSCTRRETSDEYPAGPIKIIVPYAPGGGSDTFARLISAEIKAQGLLSHPLVIINAPGAGGTIGSRRVMSEAADGYTVLLLHDGILTANRSGQSPYGPEAFESVAGTGRTGGLVVVHEDSPHRSLNDLLGAAADAPDTVTFAANLGAPSHFVGLMLEQAQGSAKLRFAQTGGGADRFAALKGHHAVATTLSLDEYLRFAPDGVRALAFLGDRRHDQIPDVATATEQGVSLRHSVMQYWWMPKGTTKERRDRFAEVLKQAMRSNRLRQQLTSMNIDAVYLEGDDLQSHLVASEAALMRVDPGVEPPLPHIPLALAALTTLLAGLLYGALGMLTALPGTSPVGQVRWTDGFSELDDGLKVLPVLIGLYAINQVVQDIIAPAQGEEAIEVSRRGMLVSPGDLCGQWFNLLRSSCIGCWIGMR